MKITEEHTYLIIHFDIQKSWDFFDIIGLKSNECDALYQQIDHLLYQATLNEGELDFLGIELIIAYVFEKRFDKLKNYPQEFFKHIEVICDGETVDFVLNLSETIVKEASIHLLQYLIQFDLFEYQLKT